MLSQDLPKVILVYVVVVIWGIFLATDAWVYFFGILVGQGVRVVGYGIDCILKGNSD